MIDDSFGPNQSFSSPVSAEVTSDISFANNGMGHSDGTDAESGTSTEFKITQALRRLEEQLSLNEDNLEEIAPFCNERETTHDLKPQHLQGGICKQEKSAALSGPDDQRLLYDLYNNGRQGNIWVLNHYCVLVCSLINVCRLLIYLMFVTSSSCTDIFGYC